MIRSLRRSLSKLRARLPRRERVGRVVPAHEQLECRVLPSTLIQLDSTGSGFIAGTLTNPATPAEFDFQATAPGRILVLMQAEQQGMQSQLTGVSGTTFSDETFVPSQLAGARDHLVQLADVTAGEVFHLDAGVVRDPTRPVFLPPVVGPYRLYISTEPTDSSATTPRLIPLDSSGRGIQLGTIEAPGAADLFAFTAPVTGRAFVRVDGGAISDQQLSIDTAPGQTYGIRVSDANNHTGPYVLTVDLIADDPSVQDLDLSKTSTLSGAIKFADDVDSFRFTATQSGVMTLKMQNQLGSDDVSTLQCALAVSGATLSYDISPSRRSSNDTPANDRVVQFDVVEGRQYTIQASGANGSVGSYLLSLSTAADDFSPAPPHLIGLDPSGAGTGKGSIEVPGDTDLFQFTATADGYVVVALMPEGSSRQGNPFNGPWEPGTNMQGLLTFPAGTPIVQGDVVASPPFPPLRFSGPLEAFSGAGWRETTRDEFAAIGVTKGDRYEFFVSAGDNTIGDYTLALATYTPGAQPTFMTRSAGNPFGNFFDDLGTTSERSLTFDFFSTIPGLHISEQSISPVSETSPATPTGPTTTRLAAFTLPSSNTTAPPATLAVPGGQSTSAATVPGGPPTSAATAPGGQATGASNSLIATLLVVAARDNSVQSKDNAVAAGPGPSDAASTLVTPLLLGLVAPARGDQVYLGSSGGDEPSVGLLIRGTVFDDLDGEGRQAANEPGVAGETVLLEAQKDGQYVAVNTATTDARGSYSFTDVRPGDYRVRLVTEAGSGSDRTTPTSYTVQVLGDRKPRTLNFRKARKSGTTRNDRGRPSHCRVVDDVVPPRGSAPCEEADQVFRDWEGVGAVAPCLDDVGRDGSASDSWLDLLAPIAILGIASTQWDIPAVERRPGTSRRQRT